MRRPLNGFSRRADVVERERARGITAFRREHCREPNLKQLLETGRRAQYSAHQAKPAECLPLARTWRGGVTMPRGGLELALDVAPDALRDRNISPTSHAAVTSADPASALSTGTPKPHSAPLLGELRLCWGIRNGIHPRTCSSSPAARASPANPPS